MSASDTKDIENTTTTAKRTMHDNIESKMKK